MPFESTDSNAAYGDTKANAEGCLRFAFGGVGFCSVVGGVVTLAGSLIATSEGPNLAAVIVGCTAWMSILGGTLVLLLLQLVGGLVRINREPIQES